MHHPFPCFRLTAVLTGLAAAMGMLQAAPITVPVQNGSFETVGATAAPWSYFPATTASNWAYTATSQYSIYKAEPTNPDASFQQAAEGTHVLNTVAATVLSQDLHYTVNPGDVVTLTFALGQSLRSPYTGGGSIEARILIGAVTAVQQFTVGTGTTKGNWYDKSFSYTATSGGNLSIAFASVSDTPWLDNVGVTVTVPEPAGLGLLALGGLALVRRRRG